MRERLRICLKQCSKIYHSIAGSRAANHAAIPASILAGFLLFSTVVLFLANSVLTDPERHTRLLSTSGIYSGVGEAVETSAAKLLSIEGSYLNAPEAETAAKTKAVQLISDDMIRLNIDNMVTGLLSYIKGKTDFLPDIYLQPSALQYSNNTAVENIETDTGDAAAADKPITGMDIDKINLSAVFMYTDRQDIPETLAFIRMLYQPALLIPPIFGLIALILLTGTFLATTGWKKHADTIALTLGAAGLTGACTSLGLYWGLKALLFPRIGTLAAALNINADSLSQYLYQLSEPLFLICLAATLLFPVSLLYFVRSQRKKSRTELDKGTKNNQFYTWMKCSAGVVLIIVLLTNTALCTASLFKDLRANTFISAYQKVTGAATMMKAIPAINDTVYTLEIKVLDSKGESPVSGAQVEVEGTTRQGDTPIRLTETSDEEGTARFSIQTGLFQVRFLQESFPAGYTLPAPLSVEVSTAGITTVTVNLESTAK